MYHSVIAGCRKVTLADLLKMIGDKPMEEEEMVMLIKWLTKFKRIDPHGVDSLGPYLSRRQFDTIQWIQSRRIAVAKENTLH